MAIEATIIILLLCFLGYWVFAKQRQYPPGPRFAWPLIGHSRLLRKGNQGEVFLKLSQVYGSVFSLTLGVQRAVILNSYSSIRQALHDKNSTGKLMSIYSHIRSQGGHGIVFSQRELWKVTRRFTLQQLRDSGMTASKVEKEIQAQIRKLLDRLTSEEIIGKPVALKTEFNAAVLNTLWAICTGNQIAYDDTDAKQTFQTIQRALLNSPASSLVRTIPYHKWIPLRFFNVKDRIKATQLVQDLLQRIIDKTKQNTFLDDNHSYLAAFLRKMNDVQQDQKSSDQLIFNELNLKVTLEDLFVGGNDTLSNSLNWFVLALALYPAVQQKIHEEIDKEIGQSTLPTYGERIKLPYLEAVLMETWRVASIVPAVNHTTTQEMQVQGFTIPKDTVLIGNLYGVHRDPTIWEKPYEFYPEHFLTPEGKFKPNPALLPFSIGKRVCPGESLARIEFFLFACGLLQKLRFQLVNKMDQNLFQGKEGLMRTPEPFQVIIYKR